MKLPIFTAEHTRRGVGFPRRIQGNLGLNSLFFWFVLAALSPVFVQAQWTVITSGSAERLNELHFPVSDTGYVVGNSGTVLRTQNGGLSWQSLSTGKGVEFHDLHFINSQEGWIVGDSATVCHTVNGGNSWNCQTLDSPATVQLHSVYAWNSQLLWIGGYTHSRGGYLVRSQNGGQSFQRAYIENYVWNIDILKIGMTSTSVGYASTRGNMLKTTDGGLNWFNQDTASVRAGKMFTVLNDLACFPNNDTVYTCGWYPMYFGRSYNGGQQWLHTPNYDCYNLDFINPRVGYIAGWGQIHKTSDAGQTFVDASAGNALLFSDVYAIDFTDEWTGYACGNNGKILRTRNGGSTSVRETSAPLVQVFPNPGRDFVRFSAVVDVHVMDLHGRILQSAAGVNQLDMQHLSAGVYVLWVQEKGSRALERVKWVKE